MPPTLALPTLECWAGRINTTEVGVVGVDALGKQSTQLVVFHALLVRFDACCRLFPPVVPSSWSAPAVSHSTAHLSPCKLGAAGPATTCP